MLLSYLSCAAGLARDRRIDNEICLVSPGYSPGAIRIDISISGKACSEGSYQICSITLTWRSQVRVYISWQRSKGNAGQKISGIFSISKQASFKEDGKRSAEDENSPLDRSGN